MDKEDHDMSEILQSDVIEWAKNYTGKPYHAMLLDPPYHLTSITKRFGKTDSAPAKGGVYGRSSAGFMGQTWDGGDIAFQPETWEALAGHLYPGAFGMAFASSRGWHRMACAIEGLHTIPTHQIKAWADLLWIARDSKRWDLVESVELAMREHIAIQEAVQSAGLIIHPTIFMMGWCYLSGFPKATRVKGAADFEGHRYGGQALKPALEPIIVFQRPYEGRPVDNITATGAGSLWIDGGRIPTNGETPQGSGNPCPNGNADIMSRALGKDGPNVTPEAGRWPSNLILQHSPLCNAACAPGCGVRALDEQAGEFNSNPNPRNNKARPESVAKGQEYDHTTMGYDDSGPASRMFHRADWQHEIAEQLANATPLRYEPKASSTEREIGLDSLETKTRHRVNAGGLENEPRFAPTQVKNNHPTVKSISLTKYLATLLLPPIAYAPRRILIPFSGVASECIGATLAGWEEVTGIEASPEYCEIARARLSWWSQWPGWGQTDVDKILAVSEEQAQLSLFTEAA